ncbi:hypothetical protein PVK06_044734 [Gossypium arboreum]|uniref:Uncharacterized protein n=1 Tax=Gossypium arboreum TaxID=29729 RepID=A0ABR0MS48_GOSAR|nr:hypothetical protein PVK06_044734 [Gossypium arboreum]
MHKADKVLRQFEFRQSILVAPQELDDLHRVDLRRSDTNWLVFHLQYIEMWNNQIYVKPYFLTKEDRHRHPHTSWPQQAPLNSIGGETDPSSAPTQELTPTASTPPPSPHPLHCVLSYFGWIVGHRSLIWYTPRSSHFSMAVTHTTMYKPSKYEAQIRSPLIIPSTYGIQHSYAHSP